MDALNFQLTLRPTVYTDLETHYQFQLDEEANYLAAFTSSTSSDKEAYLEKYAKFLNEPSINNQTILVDGTIVGSIAKFVIDGDAEITYWIDRKFWGRGIATKALKELLSFETSRPIYGRVAFDNIGSQKVLENCGFVKVGTDRGFANARQIEIEEFIYRLDGSVI
ncbi:GNAT family N-acetyltransferase [Sphingobacterium multivorum]|uniref:GNAT family N-acetyltransferase n=1 Tax=Sphingobacterium multivorum TaxID=28454 RepID=UPI003016388E